MPNGEQFRCYISMVYLLLFDCNSATHLYLLSQICPFLANRVRRNVHRAITHRLQSKCHVTSPLLFLTGPSAGNVNYNSKTKQPHGDEAHKQPHNRGPPDHEGSSALPKEGSSGDCRSPLALGSLRGSRQRSPSVPNSQKTQPEHWGSQHLHCHLYITQEPFAWTEWHKCKVGMKYVRSFETLPNPFTLFGPPNERGRYP
jgi:hypothetical protein